MMEYVNDVRGFQVVNVCKVSEIRACVEAVDVCGRISQIFKTSTQYMNSFTQWSLQGGPRIIVRDAGFDTWAATSLVCMVRYYF